jgi:DNA-directed RNA polymerase specialized sigma24 family protein
MPALARPARTRLGEVENLVQQTLLVLHLQRRTYDPTPPFSGFLKAIGTS